MAKKKQPKKQRVVPNEDLMKQLIKATQHNEFLSLEDMLPFLLSTQPPPPVMPPSQPLTLPFTTIQDKPYAPTLWLAQDNTMIKGKKTKHVPWQAEQIRYERMNPQQKQWYFYWRTAFRTGKILETDKAYLLIYAYEVLNFIEVDNPLTAVEYLWGLWISYRSTYPHLDYTIPLWAADLLLVFAGVNHTLHWWDNVLAKPMRLDATLANWLLHTGVETKSTNSMPLGMWHLIHGYTPRNAFYDRYREEYALDQRFWEALCAVETYYLAAHGTSLLNAYTPKKRIQLDHMPFRSVPMDIVVPTLINMGKSRNYVASTRLKTILVNILRYTEQALRTYYGYPYALRDIELPAELATVIQQQVIEPLRNAAPHAAPPPIVLDTNRVLHLKHEQTKIEALLHTDDETEHIEYPPITLAENSTSMPDAYRQLLQTIATNGSISLAQFEQVAQQQKLFSNVLLDRINDAMLEIVGSPILFAEAQQIEIDQEVWQEFLDR